MKFAEKTCRNVCGVSAVISTIIISATLLIILVVASFVATNLLELQIANTEFEQAKTNMLLLDEVIQDVALRPGSGGYVQFNQRSGGIGITGSWEKSIKIIGINLTTVIIKSPKSVSLFKGSWDNLRGVNQSDNSYAMTSDSGSALVCENYGFNIPSGATIISVGVGYEAYTEDNEKIAITCSWNGGNSWASTKTCNLGTSDPNTVEWVNFTPDTHWTPSKLSDANFRVKVEAVKVGGMSKVYLDWIPVKVTFVAPESLIHEFPPPLFTIVYRGGSKVSGAEMPVRGNDSLKVGLADTLGYLRVETGSGVQIKLDYDRVRIAEAGKTVVGNTLYSFIEIAYVRLIKGETAGSGTVNVKVQNIDVNTSTYAYNTTSGKISLKIKLGEKSSPDIAFDVASRTVLIVTEVKVLISIS